MIKKLYTGMIKDDFLKSGLIVFIGSFIANITNYFYQLIMGRMLGPANYGALGSLLGILLVLQVTGGSFSTVITKFTAEYYANKEYGKIRYLIMHSLKKLSIYGGGALLFCLLFTPLIASFLKIDSYLLIILIGLIGYLSLLSIISAALIGMERFSWQVGIGIINTFIKLLFATLLVYIGYEVAGALVGLVIATAIGLLLYFIPIRDIFKAKEIKTDNKEIYKYIWPVLAISVFSILLTNLDVILVKHFFSADLTGYYTAGSTIGKMIFFATGFIIVVMFPKISKEHARKGDVSKILRVSLIYCIIICSISVFAYYFFPRLIVTIMYGGEYLALVPMLGLFGVAYALFSLSNILLQYNLAVNRYKILYFILIGVVILVIGIFLFHKDLFEILKVLMVANLAVFLLCFNYSAEDIFT